MTTEVVTYGWSLNKSRYFHRVIPVPWQHGRTRIKCDGGYLRYAHSTERHHVPAHLRTCPKCFKSVTPETREQEV